MKASHTNLFYDILKGLIFPENHDYEYQKLLTWHLYSGKTYAVFLFGNILMEVSCCSGIGGGVFNNGRTGK